MMNLGDVAKKAVPKMCLVAPPRNGGAISTRTFIPHVCHSAVGVLGAVTVETACVMPNSTAYGLAKLPDGNPMTISVEHPTGEFSIEMEVGSDGNMPVVQRASLLRTARMLMEGHTSIPKSVWSNEP
jgi:4-oxalomesaconate tautomerase